MSFLRFREAEVESRLTMSCPAGLVLSPILWIVLFDSFLRMCYQRGAACLPMPDDKFLLVVADLRRDLKTVRGLVRMCQNEVRRTDHQHW